MFTPRGWYSRTNRRLSSSPNTAATLNALPILCDSRASTSSFITTTAGGIRRRRTTAEAAGIPFCSRKKGTLIQRKPDQGTHIGPAFSLHATPRQIAGAGCGSTVWFITKVRAASLRDLRPSDHPLPDIVHLITRNCQQ